MAFYLPVRTSSALTGESVRTLLFGIQTEVLPYLFRSCHDVYPGSVVTGKVGVGTPVSLVDLQNAFN
jgi:hypothetical protein